ncbi:MAG: DUF1573 domain-containing protein [Bacteroidota bacterium]
MKNILSLRNMSFLFAVVLFAFSCKSDDSARDEARQSLNSAPTPTATANPAAPAPNANPAKPAAQPPAPTGPTTSMTFGENIYDFGEIDSGEKVKHTYSFQNTGNEPLVISNATGSCGCTVPTWPKEPIPVGGKGEIVVEFDSKNKSGNQSKRVTITANTDPVNTYLTIKGKVNKINPE